MSRLKISRKKIISILLLFTFLTSIVFVAPARADMTQTQFPQGNNVSWQNEQNSTQESWNWINQGWQFGPYPSFKVFFQNGTEVTDSSYLPLSQSFTVEINILKSVFTGNSTLGQAGLHWNTNLQSQTGTSIGTADVDMMYVNSMQVSNPDGTNQGIQTNTWHIWSNINNQTGMTTVQQPMPGPQQQIGFYQFNPQLSNITESDLAWTLYITGYFNSSTPIGPYNVNLQISDQNNNSLDVNSQAGQTTQSNYRQISVGAPGYIFGNSQGSWTFSKLDMQNNPALSVSKGSNWKMVFNITAPQLSNVTVALGLPWNMQEYVNVTGWYTQVVIDQGGWMYNDSSRTYYWNSSSEITRNEQVYGPHLEQRWISLQHANHEVNVTNQQWDPVTNTKSIVTMTQYFQDQLYLIYNQATHTFDTKVGYCYNSYDSNLQRDVQYQILNSVNTSDPTTQFYELSTSDCSAYQTGPNQYIVEFVGMFTNTSDYNQDQYQLNTNVYSANGQVWNNWMNSDPSNFQIAVDRPVAVSTILDSHGNPVSQTMFLTNQGQNFTVESKIYGGTKIYQNLDAVGVSFQSSFGTWSTNQSSNSQVEIRLIKNLNTGELTSLAYNRTNVNMYIYGPHQGWAYVNVTDWHTEYNSNTGTWDWVNSLHLIWNQTTLTDWHWAYFQLNQTEYAINPNSPNIWIDSSTCWIDPMDPAFLMPTSYADLTSANITATDGMVKVDLGVVFNQAAPQGNYWYNMIFQNYTYSQDPSQGWGQHTITEWTSQPTYYINGTVTGNQPFLVQTPTNPLYTQYNGQKYQVNQLPYITIAGNNLLLKPQAQYDQAQQKEYDQYLLSDPYDPSLGRQPQYFQLMNGTKIYVDQAYQTIMRTLQITCNDSYTMTNGVKTTLPPGTTIATYMPVSTQDWNEQFRDPITGSNFVPCHYSLLNGSRIYHDGPFEQSTYNSTTSHWDLTNALYTESDQTIMAQPRGQGVLLNSTVVLLIDPGFWQPLPDGSGYYLVMQNGTRITINNPWTAPDNQRIVTLNGDSYLVGWPTQYYSATYQGQTMLIPDSNNYITSFFYTDLSINSGTKYELPYPGAMATSWWDLQGIESAGQKLPTIKTVNFNNQIYVMNLDSQSGIYYITVNGQRQPVTYPTIDYTTFYSNINGQDYWNITQNGWTLNYGTYSTQSNTINAAGSLTTTTGYDSTQQTWTANRYGFDNENATDYLTLENGTRIDVSAGMYLAIWKVQVGNQTYYTTNSNSQTECTTDPITQQQVYRNYFTTLDNQKVYFDWNTNPANWEQEIHIPIPGNNYTKLIPYSWQQQTIFDSIRIYDITIPEKTGYPTHTGVYFANGTEVPVSSQFYVIGTNYGPATYYNFAPDGNTINGAQVQWDNSMQENYATTIDGQRIFSHDQFGWIGNGWVDTPEWQLNGNPTLANTTVTATMGGYAIFLNNSIMVPVTSQGPLGGGTDNYYVMTNGTRLNVQYVNQLNEWFTVIGTQVYLFQNAMPYYNFTYQGITCSLADPLNWDQRRMLSPSIYNIPAINQDPKTWLIMNSTTESILQDGSGYYLINASDLSHLNLQQVDSWWNLSDAVRNQIFQSVNQPNPQSNYYPRYNITINGIQYYVIDPSTSIDNQNGQSVQQLIYRYPDTLNLNIAGQPYQITVKQNGFWNYNLTIQEIETINLNGQLYELQQQNSWIPSYQLPINNQEVPIQMDNMNIYEIHQAWGNIYMWRLTDLGIPTSCQVNNIIVGAPSFGMWGIKAYKVNQDTGAIALNGDLSSNSDQYYVRKIHSGSDIRNQTINRLTVTVTWNPNSSRTGDAVTVNSWMGQLEESWTSQWDEEYIWYHASDMTPVTLTEMNQIRSTVINTATGQANPGYWDMAYMVKNQSWTDIQAQAKANNWDWINTNTNSWNWLWFGTDQNYNVDVISSNGTNNAGIDLKYEFAGLSLYNGTQQTHYFMPTSVGQVSFVTPGQAYGNQASSGSMTLPLNATINFGVTYNNVNGTLFPYSSDRSMWGWWNQPIYGADFNQPDFNIKPTNTSLDQLAFMVHFGANQTANSNQYNTASMKIDQRVGNWNIDPSVIDGRQQNNSGVIVPLTGNDVLSNRSMAINYYVTASTSMGWNVKGDNGTNISNNNVQQSSTFDLASQLAGLTFASIKLGSTYDWGKPTTATDQIRTFNVTSQTTSIQNFQSSFQSDAGKSSTGFDISQSMYFLTQGFPSWDGFPIYNDPQVSLLVSKGTPLTNPQPTQGPNPQPTQQPNPSQTTQPTDNKNSQSNTNNPNNSKSSGSTQPQPTQNPSQTNQPQQTTQPEPTQKESPQAQIPTTLIAIGAAIGIAIAASSMAIVKKKKK